MSKNTFTAAQTATFDNFRSEVEQYMLDNSEGNKSFRLMDVPTFLSVFKVASQPTKLRPVGNFTSSLKERGRTKLRAASREHAPGLSRGLRRAPRRRSSGHSRRHPERSIQ